MTLRPKAIRPGTRFLFAFLAAGTLTAVTPEPTPIPSPLDAASRSQLVEEIAKALETMYVDPVAGRRMAAEMRRRSADRGYDRLQTVPEFASRLTRELQELGKDKHLAVLEASQQGATVQRVERRRAEDAGSETRPRVVRHHGGAGGPEMERWKRSNYGVERAERLEGNVGYLRITGFPPGEGAKTAFAGAMGVLAGTDSLIVDLRECPGGVPETVNFLASYFFSSEPVELISRYNRHTDETEKDFTLREVPGARRAEADLRILTSANTGSACESFAYILQQHQRARVLGERTAGAGHLAARIPIGSGLVMSVSVGRPIHPRTGRGWEGTGVEPDAAIAAPSALRMAHQEALSALWERASDTAQKRRVAWALEASKAAENLPPAPKLLQTYTGKYGEREITLDPDGLVYRGPGGRRWGPLLAVGPDLFAIDEEVRLLFERNGRGEVTALQLMRGDGSSERVPKGSGSPQATLAANRAHARPANANAGALPDSPGGRRAAALFEALGSGSPEKRRQLIQDNYAGTALKEASATDRASRFAAVVANHPGLTPRRVLSSETSRIVVLAEDSRGAWLEVTVWMEEAPPHRILRVALDLSERDAAPREKPKGSDAEIARAVEEHLGKLAATDQFSGVVLLAKDGKPFFEKAYGLENRERNVANTLDTRFNIGSIDKTLTQVAIAQLASQGKLDFSDTIRRHLPDYPSPAAEKITIQHLLTMSSGLGDIFGDRYRAADKGRLRRLSDYLAFFADLPLLFEPGSDRRYSNAGYVVLGLIIEKVSGREYHDYVRQDVRSPAGMTDSGPIDPRAAAERFAIGYTRQLGAGGPGRARQRNTETLPARSSSAGGSYATAADLLKLDLALRNDTLLPPESGDWLFSDKRQNSGQRRPRSGGFGVAGGLPGGNATLEIDLDRGYTVIVLSNDDPPSAETVARKIRQWIGI